MNIFPRQICPITHLNFLCAATLACAGLTNAVCAQSALDGFDPNPDGTIDVVVETSADQNLAVRLQRFCGTAHPRLVLGPLVGVWFELRRRQRCLNFTPGALLGFYSAFYGTIAAFALNQVAVRIVHGQLWRFENLTDCHGPAHRYEFETSSLNICSLTLIYPAIFSSVCTQCCVLRKSWK